VIAALISYLKRKQTGQWGTPKVSDKFNIGYGVIAIITLQGIIFPLFGISVLIIILTEYLKNRFSQS
jgi:uncharacterized iron-regulated membrane protein